jgi:hypothetical protein
MPLLRREVGDIRYEVYKLAKIVKHIKKIGWPVYTRSGRVSERWKKAHPAANRAALKKYGAKIAKAINKIKVPKGELLGSHTKAGKIKVSSIVPKKLRKAIVLHEKVEHRLMVGKHKK